jgi:opacity protein-like surface antigen
MPAPTPAGEFTMTGRVGTLAMLAVGMAAATPVAAQVGESLHREPTRWSLSGGLVVAQPVGEFSEYVGTGAGAAAQVLFRVDPAGIFSLRADAGFVNYGNETKRVCFSTTVGCRIELDLTTSNNILLLGFGPHVELPLPYVRPFVHAGIGGAYFATTSSVSGTNRDDDFASTTNHDDLTFSWLLGGGVNIPVTRGAAPVSIQLAARYHANGTAEYVRRGGITDHPDGSITVNATRSEANLVTWQIGVSALSGRSRHR